MAKARPAKRVGPKGARPRAPAAPKVAAVALTPSSIRGAYDVVCSECYAEFEFRAPGAAERTPITCPDCLHVGSVAAGDVMSRVAQAKRSERSYLTRAVLPSVLVLACGLSWVVGLTYFELAGSDAANYSFLGVLVLLIGALIFGLSKYESNRFDVYF